MRLFATIFLITVTAFGQRQTFFQQNTPAYPTYTDNFNRANGALTFPWSFPSGAPGGAGGAPVILSNALVAGGSLPGTHYLDIYSGGHFGNNQYCKYVIQSLPNGTYGGGVAADSTGCVLHGTNSNFYNDAVQNFPGTGIEWAIGIAVGTDFGPTAPVFQGTPTYSVGDTVQLNSTGTNPILFTHLHNGVVDATAADATFLLTGGVPGVGVAINSSATPTVILDNFEAGTLPSPSTNPTPTDNFTRADGWMGINWWFMPPSTYSCAYQITSNKAKSTCTSDAFAGALWANPFGQTQASTITEGTTDVWEGPVVRADPAGQSYYVAFYYFGMNIYVQTGSGFVSLGTVGSLSAAPTTLELDASGTSTVTLTVIADGVNIGSLTDSTYHLSGSYEGFVANGTGVTVNQWSGH